MVDVGTHIRKIHDEVAVIDKLKLSKVIGILSGGEKRDLLICLSSMNMGWMLYNSL
jgi:hypothetical protein